MAFTATTRAARSGASGPALIAAAGLAVALAAVGGAATGADPAVAFLAGAGTIGAGAAGWLVLRIDPVWPLSLGIAGAIFSGNSELLGLPVPPDRLLIAVGLVSFFLQGAEREGIRVRSVHWVMLAAAVWAIVSAARAGTIGDSAGRFGLLDSFGLVPFALFLVAPAAFREARQRNILLGTLVVTGGYLGLTALFEAIGADALVVPTYVTDPNVGIHADRARGPFVEAVANGMAMYACAVAAAVGLTQWRDQLARLGCWAVIALCAAGLVFTLTRSVWLASAVATVVTLASFRSLWRYLVPAVAAGAALVAIALAVVPGLSQSASERENEDASIWVRENTNRAALKMIEARPVAGFGWNRFERESVAYFEQEGDTPLNGVGEGVHNVLLSHATELGLVGAFLWLCAWLLGIGGAIARRGPPELHAWRIGLLALAVHWVIVAATTPLPYAYPALVLWTWAGVVMADTRRREAWA